MKNYVFIFLTLLIGLPNLAQETVQVPPSVLAAGGNSEGTETILSRWRLSRVHLITLPEDINSVYKSLPLDESSDDWLVSLYPNPVTESLNIEFELSETRDFIIYLTDITGRILIVQEARTIYPDEIFELNMSELSPALYLLHIATPDRQSHKIFRTQKI